jgi:TonB family protein
MKKDIIPFSYFNKIFIPESVSAEHGLQSIIDHEKSHLRQMHFVDLFLVEVITIIQWFNPFAWLYERSVKEVHEYLADRSVLSRGYNQGNYQALLVNQAMGGPVFTIANQFNQSLIKKRIVMMTKMKSPRLAQLKSFLLLPVIAIILMAYNQPEKAVEVLSSLNPEASLMPAATPSPEPVNVESANIPSSKQPVSNVKAEQIKIVGKVVDSETGKDMPGVAIVIKGTTTGTITDNAGDFAILVPDRDAVLVFSSVGYNTQLIPIKNNDRMYVKLEESIVKINLSGPNSLIAKDKPASFEKSPGDTYVVVEELPSYPGGTDALKKFIAENLKYPADAKGKITGMVPVNFIIDREGNIVNPKVSKSLYPSLDEEALRVVKLIKGWKPGMQNGKPVACKVSLPVYFK